MSGVTKLIILRGNSGSGKSTTGKALQRKFGQGTMLISQDVVRREMSYVKNAQRFYKSLSYVKTNQIHYKKRMSE